MKVGLKKKKATPQKKKLVRAYLRTYVTHALEYRAAGNAG
jgi:hypothetical protein